MVFIVPPSGEKFALDVNPNTITLHELKVAIEEIINGMPVSNQRLFLKENDCDLICNLVGVGPMSTLILRSADDTTVKESIAKEEEEELDRKAKDDEEELKRKEEEEEEYRKKMLMVKFNESKLMHARSKRAIQIKRNEDQFFEIMMAELHQEDIQANVNQMKRFMWELEEIEREAKGKRQAQKQRTS